MVLAIVVVFTVCQSTSGGTQDDAKQIADLAGEYRLATALSTERVKLSKSGHYSYRWSSDAAEPTPPRVAGVITLTEGALRLSPPIPRTTIRNHSTSELLVVATAGSTLYLVVREDLVEVCAQVATFGPTGRYLMAFERRKRGGGVLSGEQVVDLGLCSRIPQAPAR